MGAHVQVLAPTDSWCAEPIALAETAAAALLSVNALRAKGGAVQNAPARAAL